jgi:hypothetical protein
MQGSTEFQLAKAAKQMKVSQQWQGVTSLSRQQVFWIVLGGFFAWQFLPEWMFPFVASLAPLCWFASKSHTLNFLGAGRGGAGILNITLDWSNITSTVVTYPYSVQVTIFVSFVITTWILIPVAYFGNLWGSPTYNIMSNGVFTKNGTAYPFTKLRMSC